MTNAELFKNTFNGLFATEMWAKSEQEFLKWLNSETEQTRVLSLEEVMKHYSLPTVFVDDLRMQEDYFQDIQPLYFEFQHDLPWNVHWLNYDQVANIREGIKDGYGTIIRAWSARPTKEQREATPWGKPPKEEN